MQFKTDSKKIDSCHFITIECGDFKLISCGHYIRMVEICNKSGVKINQMVNSSIYEKSKKVVELAGEEPIMYILNEIYGDYFGVYYHEYIVNKFLVFCEVDTMNTFA
jgi:hypothetical protein